MKIVIVDYGMGNLRSIASTLQYLGAETIVSNAYAELKSADKIILPGVGSFAQAMKQIREKELDVYLKELVVDNKKPLLGICLGMQLLGKGSPEDGVNQGLGFVKGEVSRFPEGSLKVPHVGFNQVKPNEASRLYRGLSPDPDFYFTHSYRMLSDENINQSMCDYDGEFVASFEVDSIAGVQFHPELSQQNGLQLLKNFIAEF
jgi:glutamine amidotransferase